MPNKIYAIDAETGEKLPYPQPAKERPINLIDAKSGKTVSFKTIEEANLARKETNVRGAPVYGYVADEQYKMFTSSSDGGSISNVSGEELNAKLGNKELSLYGESFATKEQTAQALSELQWKLVGEEIERRHGKTIPQLGSLMGLAKGVAPIGVERAMEVQGVGYVGAYLRRDPRSRDLVTKWEVGVPLTQMAIGLSLIGATAFVGSTGAIPTGIASLALAAYNKLPSWVLKRGPDFIEMVAKNKYAIAALSGGKGAFNIINFQAKAIDKAARMAAGAAGSAATAGGLLVRNVGLAKQSPQVIKQATDFLLSKGGTLATGTARATAYGVASGAAYSVATMETRHLLGDVEYSAENFKNAAKEGALFDVGFTGLVLALSRGGRMAQELIRRLPLGIGTISHAVPLLPKKGIDISGEFHPKERVVAPKPKGRQEFVTLDGLDDSPFAVSMRRKDVIDLSGGLDEISEGMTKVGRDSMVGRTENEKFTMEAIRAATVDNKIVPAKLAKAMAVVRRDTNFSDDLSIMLNDPEWGRRHGLDGALMNVIMPAEQLILRADVVKKKALVNRNQAETDIDNSPSFEASRQERSQIDKASEQSAVDHQVDLDSKLERVSQLEMQKKNLEQGKDQEAVMGRRIGQKEKIELEGKINRIKNGEATTQEVLEELDHLDTSQEELDSLNLIHSEEGGEGFMRARGQVLHDTGTGKGGQLVHDKGKKIQIEDEWNAYNASKKSLEDKELILDDYIYEGRTENIDLDLERGNLQEAMVKINKTLALGNELDDNFQQQLAEILETFQLEGSLLDDLGWRISTIDGKKTLEGFRRSIAKPATSLRKAHTKDVEPAPLSEVANVTYNSLRASRDMFTAVAKRLGLHRREIMLAKRSDIRQEKEALKGRPKPPSAESAGYKEEKIKRLVLKKLAQKKAELGQRQRVMKEDSALQAELLDGDIVAAKEHAERLAYDIIPSTRHPGSESVEFHMLADDLLLSVKRRWARENAPAPSADTPYSESRFKKDGRVEIEHAEKIADDWRRNGDNTTFTEAQVITSDLGAITYNHTTQDYEVLNKVKTKAYKLLRAEMERKIGSTARKSFGEEKGNAILAAYVDGNRTFNVLETLLNATSKGARKPKTLRDMWDWSIYFIGKRFGVSGPKMMGAMALKSTADNFMNMHNISSKYRSKYVYQMNKMTKYFDGVNSEMNKGITQGRKYVKDTSRKFVEGLGVPPGSVVLRLATGDEEPQGKTEPPKRGPGRPRKEPKASEPISALFTPMDVLGVNREGDRAGDSRRDAYWKRAREISAAVKRPSDTDEILTAAYQPISLWDAGFAEQIKLSVQKELEYLGSILTKRYDMQGNPEPTMEEIDRLELALNVLANTEASIYDRFLDGTLDNFSMEVFNNLRPKSAIEFKEAVADIGQRYGHMIPYQKQLVMSKVIDMNLGSVPTADLTNGIQAVVYAPDEQEPSMGNKPLGIASRTETPLEKGVQRDEWGVRARPEMTLGMV